MQHYITRINKIKNTFVSSGVKISFETVKRYIQGLQDSLLFYSAAQFKVRGRELLQSSEKYYLVDIGLSNTLLGKHKNSDRGHILENIVYLELLHRGYQVWTGASRHCEIDFVCKTPSGDIEYYQVAWEMSNEKTVEREFGSLEKISDNYPKYILTTESFTVNPTDGYGLIETLTAADDAEEQPFWVITAV